MESLLRFTWLDLNCLRKLQKPDHFVLYKMLESKQDGLCFPE